MPYRLLALAALATAPVIARAAEPGPLLVTTEMLVERRSAAPDGTTRVALARPERVVPGERVTLATVHAAKGLEWRAVRVVGLEEGVFPHARALLDGGLEEERRLAYVAITRAREQLVLSRATHRHGRVQLPSRFLAEAVPDLAARLAA